MRLCIVAWATTLLLATTTRAEDADQKAEESIKKLQGRLTRDEKAPSRPIVGVEIVGATIKDEAIIKELATLKNLTSLKLVGVFVYNEVELKSLTALKSLTSLEVSGRLGDSGLMSVASFKNLKSLSVRGARVSDAGMKEIGRLDGLVTLDLSETDVTNTGLKELANLKKLTSLKLNYSKMTDAGVKTLASLENLTSLSLDFTDVSDEGARTIVASFKNLESLGLSGTRVTDAGVKRLAALPKLKSLDLSYAFKVTNASIDQLAAMTNLVNLKVSQSEINEEGQRVIHQKRKAYQEMSKLDLSGRPITDAMLKELANFKNLSELNLRGTRVTDAGLKELAVNESLTSLNLGGTRVTDTGMKELKQLKNLTKLDLTLTRISDEGLRDIVRINGLTELSLRGTMTTNSGLKELAAIKNLKTLDLALTEVTQAGLNDHETLKKIARVYSSKTVPGLPAPVPAPTPTPTPGAPTPPAPGTSTEAPVVPTPVVTPTPEQLKNIKSVIYEANSAKLEAPDLSAFPWKVIRQHPGLSAGLLPKPVTISLNHQEGSVTTETIESQTRVSGEFIQKLLEQIGNASLDGASPDEFFLDRGGKVRFGSQGGSGIFAPRPRKEYVSHEANWGHVGGMKFIIHETFRERPDLKIKKEYKVARGGNLFRVPLDEIANSTLSGIKNLNRAIGAPATVENLATNYKVNEKDTVEVIDLADGIHEKTDELIRKGRTLGRAITDADVSIKKPEKRAVWVKVRAGEKTGWILSDYLANRREEYTATVTMSVRGSDYFIVECRVKKRVFEDDTSSKGKTESFNSILLTASSKITGSWATYFAKFMWQGCSLIVVKGIESVSAATAVGTEGIALPVAVELFVAAKAVEGGFTVVEIKIFGDSESDGIFTGAKALPKWISLNENGVTQVKIPTVFDLYAILDMNILKPYELMKDPKNLKNWRAYAVDLGTGVVVDALTKTGDAKPPTRPSPPITPTPKPPTPVVPPIGTPPEKK